MQAKNNYPNLGIYEGNTLRFLSNEDIICCKSGIGNTTITLISGDKVSSTKSLKELEEILDKDIFFRVHNSSLINLMHLDCYISVEDDKLIMKDGTQVQLSRRRKQDFLNKFIRF